MERTARGGGDPTQSGARAGGGNATPRDQCLIENDKKRVVAGASGGGPGEGDLMHKLDEGSGGGRS